MNAMISEVVEKIEEKAEGFWEDLLSKGGKRTHALATILAVFTMCICCIVLTIGAVAAKLREVKQGMVPSQGLQNELTAAYLGLVTLVGYVYKKGKEAFVTEAKPEDKGAAK